MKDFNDLYDLDSVEQTSSAPEVNAYQEDNTPIDSTDFNSAFDSIGYWDSEPTVDDSGEFVKGAASALRNTVSGGKALIGGLMGDFEMQYDSLTDMQRNSQENMPAVGEIEDIDGISEFGDWLAYNLGSGTASIGTMVAGGGLGGLAAKGLIKGAGSAAAKAIGAGATGFAPNFGESLQGGYEETGKIENQAAFASAGIKTALDSLTPLKLLRGAGKSELADRLSEGVKQRLINDSTFKTWAKEMLSTGATEAFTEGLQTYTDQVMKNILGEEENVFAVRDISEIANAAASGVAGSLGAGAISGYQQSGVAKRLKAQPNLDDELAGGGEVDLTARKDEAPSEGYQAQDDIDLNIPTVARNAGVNNQGGLYNFGNDFIDNASMRQGNNAAQNNPLVPVSNADTWKPNFTMQPDQMGLQQYQQGGLSPYEQQSMEGEWLNAERQPPNSVPVGQVLEAPIIEGEFERPRGLPDRSNVIYGEDGRPMQQAQEFAQQAANNYQPQIEQKDIIFAGDERGVQLKQDGTPFGGKKAVSISKGFKDANARGLNPSVVQVNGGYGWIAENDNAGLASGSGEIQRNQQVRSAGDSLPHRVRGEESGRLRDDAREVQSVDGADQAVGDANGQYENALTAAGVEQEGTESEVSNTSFVTPEMQRKQDEKINKGRLSRVKYLKTDTDLDKLLQDVKEDKASSVDLIREIETAVNTRKSELETEKLNSQVSEINTAANEAATSPLNELAEPTQGQKEAGNYKKGKVKLHGLNISIENPKGSERKGVDESGKEWTSTMAHHYGDIKGTVGADGDSIDTFIGDKPTSEKVFVVDQINPNTGEFDEHKVMLGFDSKEAAEAGYLSNYDKDWKGAGNITETTTDELKSWMKKPRKSKQPFAPIEKNLSTETVDNLDISTAKANELTVDVGRSNNSTKLKEKTPSEQKILSVTENAWVKSEIKKLGLKKDSPGYEDAVKKVKIGYETAYDDAVSQVSFERYKELNPDTPETILRKSYDSIKTPNILFNRSGKETKVKGVTEKAAKLAFTKFNKEFKGLDDEGFEQFITSKKPSELFGPEVAGDDNFIKGAFDKNTNRLYIFTSNHQSIEDVRRTLREELITHKGIGVFSEKEISNLLDRINSTRDSKDAAIQDIWDDVNRNYSDKGPIIQAEEFLGKVSQNKVKIPAKYWDRIVAAFQKVLRKFGLVKDQITMAEMRLVVSHISEKLRDGKSPSNYKFDAQKAKVDTSKKSSDNIRLNRSAVLDDARDKLGLGEKETFGIVDNIKQGIEGFNFKGWRERATEGVFDSLYGIKKAEESVGITQEQQGYVSARLASGVGDVVHGVMFHGAPEWRDGIVQRKAGSKGMLEVFGQLDEKQLNDWLAWMGGNRADVLMKEGRENNLSQSEINELMKLNEGREDLFNKVKNEYNAINAATLDLAEGAGLVSKDVRNKFDSDWYVPFFRQEETDDIGEVISGGFNPSGIANQSGNLNKLKGGKMATNDILENILKRQATLIEASMKNKAMSEVSDNLSGTGLMEPTKLNKIEAEQVARSRLTSNVSPFVSVMKNGEKMWYKVNEPSLLRGLVQLNVKRTDHPLMKMSRAAKRFLTTGVTLSPEFILRNFIRDGAHGWMINKDKFKFGFDSVNGAVKTWTKDEATLDIMFSGASFQGGYVHATDPEAAAQQIRRALRKKGLNEGEISKYLGSIPKNMGKMLEKYRDISDSMENANRVSTYSASIEAGKSKKVASFEARDFMDFSLQGNYRTMQWLVDVIPFLNARLQGMYKLYRAGKADGDNNAFLKVFSRELAMKGSWVAGFSLTLAMLNSDNEDYEELPDWDKDANWHFFIGDDHIRIPKPFELGIIFGTMPERLLMRGLGKQNNKDMTNSITHAVVSTMSFNPLPQIIRPATESFMNYDTFSMRPIDGFSDLRKRPEDRYSMYTTETAKTLGKTLGMSPNQIEHLIRGYAGTLGAYVLSASDMLANSAAVATGKGEFKYNELDDISVVRAFYKSGEVGSTYYREKFYEMLTEVNAINSQYKTAMEERDLDTAKEILSDGKIKLKYRSKFNKAQAAMNRLSNKGKLIWKNKALSLEEREEKLDELSRLKNALARRIILQYRTEAD